MKRALGLALSSLFLMGHALAGPQEDYSAGRKAYLAGDVVGAMPALRRAADDGYAPAQSLYGYILDKAEYDEEAAQYFRRAAYQCDADGQYGLAMLYATGEGVACVQKEIDEAGVLHYHALWISGRSRRINDVSGAVRIQCMVAPGTLLEKTIGGAVAPTQ